MHAESFAKTILRDFLTWTLQHKHVKEKEPIVIPLRY